MGAAGYLLKRATKQEVLATVRAALAGDVHVQADVAAGCSDSLLGPVSRRVTT